MSTVSRRERARLQTCGKIRSIDLQGTFRESGCTLVKTGEGACCASSGTAVPKATPQTTREHSTELTRTCRLPPCGRSRQSASDGYRKTPFLNDRTATKKATGDVKAASSRRVWRHVRQLLTTARIVGVFRSRFAISLVRQPHREVVHFGSETTRYEPTSDWILDAHARRYARSGSRTRGASCPATHCSTSSRGRSASRGSPRRRGWQRARRSPAPQKPGGTRNNAARGASSSATSRAWLRGALWPRSLDRSSSPTPREPTRAAASRSLALAWPALRVPTA